MDDFPTERASTGSYGSDGEGGNRGIQVTVLDEVKAKKNDTILQRLEEAKAMDRNRVSSSGAVMHNAPWNKAKQPVDGEMPNIADTTTTAATRATEGRASKASRHTCPPQAPPAGARPRHNAANASWSQDTLSRAGFTKAMATVPLRL